MKVRIALVSEVLPSLRRFDRLEIGALLDRVRMYCMLATTKVKTIPSLRFSPKTPIVQ